MAKSKPALPVESESHSYAQELRAFCLAFFTQFDCVVAAVDNDPAGALCVRLTAPLDDHFGATELQLRFHQTATNAGELVAYGSRIFDRMMAFLDDRSAVTLLSLPKRFAGGEELLRAVKPVNAGIAGLKMSEANSRWVLFDWHITYRADDKREELYSVLLDEEGALLEQPVIADATGDRGAGDLGTGDRAPTGTAPVREAVLIGDSAVGLGSLAVLLRDGEPEPPAVNADGQPVPPKLPAMAQLARLAEVARKYAIYHADLRCIEHEAEILPRLHKSLARITGYYNQQISEVYDSHDVDGEKRRALEADLARKVAEEVENHRLRVQVRLFSYAVFTVPMAAAALSLNDGRHVVDLRIQRNLYTGRLQRPLCDACGNEATQIAIDRHGHVTCDECICQCQSCQEIYCATCGVAPCSVCGRENCDECSQECWACGQRACHEHIERCPSCGDTVCLACQTACAACGVMQCRAHLRADCVADSVTDGGEPALICRDCAVQCPGCRQYSAQLGICAISGQRFCHNCLVTCADCGQVVGTGFYETQPATGAVRCHNCLMTCPTCGAFTATFEQCTVCAKSCCANCGSRCQICGAIHCREHNIVQPGCAHLVCAVHATECAIGEEPCCPICHPPCGICGRAVCEEHQATCARCRQAYCQECVRISGLCDTCATMDRDGEFVPLVDEPCASDVRVALVLPHYRWARAMNERYTIYLGRDSSMQAALIVVERTATGDEVRRVNKLGALDTPYRARWGGL